MSTKKNLCFILLIFVSVLFLREEYTQIIISILLISVLS